MSITYPSGYGRDELSIEMLMERHCPRNVTEPEFRRRVEHWLRSKNGIIGIGDRLPRPNPHGVSGASAAGRSFHQLQQWSDGSLYAAALDLVVRRPGLGHSSGHVPWSEVPVQGSNYAQQWGVHMNVPGEPWHIQCIEYDGWYSWDRAGRKRPDPNFQLPCVEPPPPTLVFNPRNAEWGLWPVKGDKPRLSTREWMLQRQERADNRWRWTGDGVLYLQGVIFHKAGGNITVDGYFGPQTKGRVEDVQGLLGTTADGLVGPATWKLIDLIAVK